MHASKDEDLISIRKSLVFFSKYLNAVSTFFLYWASQVWNPILFTDVELQQLSLVIVLNVDVSVLERDLCFIPQWYL